MSVKVLHPLLEFCEDFQPEVTEFKIPKSQGGYQSVHANRDFLNNGQKKGFDLFVNYALGVAYDPEGNSIQALGISGEAGTGKSTMTLQAVAEILNRTKNQDFRIAISAPTHEAVGVAKLYSPFQEHPRVDFRTVQSLCGMRMITDEDQLNEKGEVIEKFQYDESKVAIHKYDMIIVDEASQVVRTALGIMYQPWMKTGKTKFVFIGDDAQLPPVKNAGNKSPVYDPSWHKLKDKATQALIFNFHLHKLTEQMRTGIGDPVHELALAVRNYRKRPGPLKEGLVSKSNCRSTEIGGKSHVIHYKGETRDSAILSYIKTVFNQGNGYEKNSRIGRILCYQNKRVAYWNKLARLVRYHELYKQTKGNLPDYLVGESIKFTQQHFIEGSLDDGRDKTLVFYSNQEVRIVEAVKKDFQNYDMEIAGIDPLPGYELVVENTFTGEQRKVQVLEKRAYPKFWNFLKATAKKAVAAKKKKNYELSGQLWADYYHMKEIEVAFVTHCYAQTIHKSQGSSYDYVLMDLSDTMTCKNYQVFKALMYVGVSRARQGLVMFEQATG
ncbi:MAG: AAA family ATPase [Bacteroidota bacterium]